MLTQTQTALNRERTPPNTANRRSLPARGAADAETDRIAAGTRAARRRPGDLKRLRFDFSKTISDCVELIKPLADERGVKIVSELAPLEITGDSERLAQVVTNLLTNAIQYNQPGGEVRVKLESQNGLAVLTVADTGAGIAAGRFAARFREDFFARDKSRTGGGNAGLGLAISKAIVEAHGGTIEVASVEGTGTTFTVRLPI